MTAHPKRTLFHRLTGFAALALFTAFMGNIVLAKFAMMIDFAAPRLSAQTEFLIVLAATLLTIIYLLREEKRKAPSLADPTDHDNDVQPEEETP